MAGIAEIREPDAPPEIAEIYALIKEASGVPQLNLIWRHFATEPAVLSWAWEAMSEALRSGAVARAAAQLQTDLLPATSDPVWHTLAPDAAADVQNLMAFYTRGNTQNLIGLTALLLWEHGEGAGSSSSSQSADTALLSNAAPTRAIPPLPKRDQINANLLNTVDRLAKQHGGASLGVTPSMYLHLADLPGALDAVDRRLGTTIGSDAFASETQRTIDIARRRAAPVAATLNNNAPRPDDATLQPMLTTLQSFVTTTIPEMVVVGQLLSGAQLRDQA